MKTDCLLFVVFVVVVIGTGVSLALILDYLLGPTWAVVVTIAAILFVLGELWKLASPVGRQ